MFKNIFIFLILVISFQDCTDGQEPATIQHSSIVGNYFGFWQECIIQNMEIDCLTPLESTVRIIIFNQSNIIIQDDAIDLKDTMSLIIPPTVSENSIFNFEKSKNNTRSTLTYDALNKSIKYCSQLLTDSMTVEKCFEGIKI